MSFPFDPQILKEVLEQTAAQTSDQTLQDLFGANETNAFEVTQNLNTPFALSGAAQEFFGSRREEALLRARASATATEGAARTVGEARQRSRQRQRRRARPSLLGETGLLTREDLQSGGLV